MTIATTVENASVTSASCVYGPVRSWRFGSSLGLDLLLHSSICSFNCIYCQLGDIQVKTLERKIYVPTDKVERDLRLSDWEQADRITLSGSGEPTLALNLGEVIHCVKEYTKKPVMVLNATTLNDPAVQRALQEADEVACKLDAATEVVFQRMNRPVPGVTLASVVQGITAFKASGYSGKLSLQCMFMPSNEEDVEALTSLIAAIEPDEVQLNTPKRPYPLEWVLDSRGNHTEALVESRRLRLIEQEQALTIETLLRSKTSVPILSIYPAA
jgi:wyosine [tRNA(Phe)-imidazoG37] synthetase (radical SAM superfamily)